MTSHAIPIVMGPVNEDLSGIAGAWGMSLVRLAPTNSAAQGSGGLSTWFRGKPWETPASRKRGQRAITRLS